MISDTIIGALCGAGLASAGWLIVRFLPGTKIDRRITHARAMKELGIELTPRQIELLRRDGHTLIPAIARRTTANDLAAIQAIENPAPDRPDVDTLKNLFGLSAIN